MTSLTWLAPLCLIYVGNHLPIYLVSPQLLVTSEHIISASASSSFSLPVLSSSDSGEAVPLFGLGRANCTGVPFVVEFPVGGATDALLSSMLILGVADRPALASSRLSNVARSVLPSSSSGRTPDRRISDSMRASRFSRPSMYLALLVVSISFCPAHPNYPPLRRLPFLLDLCEDAFCLVILAVCT
jgi:hypothetical protein